MNTIIIGLISIHDLFYTSISRSRNGNGNFPCSRLYLSYSAPCAVTQFLTKNARNRVFVRALAHVVTPLFSHSLPDDDARTGLETLDIIYRGSETDIDGMDNHLPSHTG